MITQPPISDPARLIERAYSPEPANRMLVLLSSIFALLLVLCVGVWAGKQSSSVPTPAVSLAAEPVPIAAPPCPSPCGYQEQTYRMRDYVVEDSHGSHLEGGPGELPYNTHIYAHR